MKINRPCYVCTQRFETDSNSNEACCPTCRRNINADILAKSAMALAQSQMTSLASGQSTGYRYKKNFFDGMPREGDDANDDAPNYEQHFTEIETITNAIFEQMQNNNKELLDLVGDLNIAISKLKKELNI